MKRFRRFGMLFWYPCWRATRAREMMALQVLAVGRTL